MQGPTGSRYQCCQPPILSPNICAKSESNPKCLRKTEKAQISGQMQIICTGCHLWLQEMAHYTNLGPSAKFDLRPEAISQLLPLTTS